MTLSANKASKAMADLATLDLKVKADRSAVSSSFSKTAKAKAALAAVSSTAASAARNKAAAAQVAIAAAAATVRVAHGTEVEVIDKNEIEIRISGKTLTLLIPD